MTYIWLKLPFAEHCRQMPKLLREKSANQGGADPNIVARIKAALGRGHSLKSVCDCLAGDGIRISVQTLGSYITRMRRKTLSVAGVQPARISESAR
jgi:hypothetical protein